jgi:hypothetical protein
MPLLNYTTSVPVARTVAQIHGLLVEAGARQIGTDYDATGQPVGIMFVTDTVAGPRAFVLPVIANRVQAVLEREKVERRYRTPEHSQRVAWRIVKDWVEAQLAIIRTEMVTLDQVMLPYMKAGPEGETVYELYRQEHLALPMPSERS